MNVNSFKEIRTKKRELTIITLLKWTITVLVSIMIAYTMFSDNPEIAAGIILSGTVPSATAATLYTFLAAGNTSLVIASSMIDIAISPLITPLSMSILSGSTVVISFFELLRSFLIIVIIPLSAGILFQRFSPKMAAYSRPVTKLGSSLTLLLIIHTIVGKSKHSIAENLDLLALITIAVFIQVALPMAAAYFIAKHFSFNEADARAALFQAGLCNTALASILAFEFIGSLGAIPPIINMVINLSLGAFISNYFSKKKEDLSPILVINQKNSM